MKKILENIWYVFLILIILGVIAYVGNDVYRYYFPKEDLGRSVVTDPISLTASSTLTIAGATNDGTSESKPAILGTSTVEFQIDPIIKDIQIGDGVDMFCMNIFFAPSTTDAVLNWKYSFSNDGTNFYFEDDDPVVSSGAYTHGAGTTTHSWTIGSTDERSRQDCVPHDGTRLNSKYIRVEFTRSADLSGGKIFAEGWTKTKY